MEAQQHLRPGQYLPSTIPTRCHDEDRCVTLPYAAPRPRFVECADSMQARIAAWIATLNYSFPNYLRNRNPQGAMSGGP